MSRRLGRNCGWLAGALGPLVSRVVANSKVDRAGVANEAGSAHRRNVAVLLAVHGLTGKAVLAGWVASRSDRLRAVRSSHRDIGDVPLLSILVALTIAYPAPTSARVTRSSRWATGVFLERGTAASPRLGCSVNVIARAAGSPRRASPKVPSSLIHVQSRSGGRRPGVPPPFARRRRRDTADRPYRRKVSGQTRCQPSRC